MHSQPLRKREPGDETRSALTHGGQPLGANLRREVGEHLWKVCGGRPVALAHVEVIRVIWSWTQKHTQTHTHPISK